ncbi:MAG: c-type cytochrome domain-containing protein [Verrucomicrobiota bacterium]
MADDRVDFNFQVRPLLSDRCFFCHGPDEKARKGKLRLDQRDGVFAPAQGWQTRGGPRESGDSNSSGAFSSRTRRR